MITRALTLGVSLLSSLVVVPAVYAQGPWPVLNRPTLTAPLQEFAPNNANYYQTPNYYQAPVNQAPRYAPAQTNWPAANGYGAANCPNGQCGVNRSCPNGQCATGQCANGQCAPRQGTNCPNGQCSPMRTRVNSGIAPWGNGQAACPNGQCGVNRGMNYQGVNTNTRSLPPAFNPAMNYAPVNQPGYRMVPQPRTGFSGANTVNRLVPLEDASDWTLSNRSTQRELNNLPAFEGEAQLR